MHKIEELKLKNGAKLVNVIVENLPISIVSVWFRAGSRFDLQGKEGLAHFLEHVFMKRTKKYPDDIERLKAIDSHGIKFNAFTGYETMHFYHIQTKDETFASLEFLLDGLNDFILKEGDIEKEKQIVTNEMLENKLSPQNYIWNLAYQALWKNSTMGKAFFGTEESINSFTLDDLNEFIAQNYVAENCTFVIIGNEDTMQLADYLNKNLVLENKQTNLEKEEFEKPEKIAILKTNDQHIVISIAYETFSINNTSELPVLDFVREYLSNNWISKTIEEMRLKRNITYWVDGETEFFSDTGVLRFSYSCDKKILSESVKICLAEINKIKEDLFETENLEVFKKSFLSSLAIRFTDPYEYLLWYGRQATIGKKIFSLDEYIQAIKKISNDDVQKVVLKYLNDENLSIAVIGDLDDDSIDL